MLTRTVRLFMGLESASFLIAALIHFGVLLEGYEHQKAGTAESVIGLVLLTGLFLTWLRPQSSRQIGIGAQGFALLATFVGLFTIIIGVGPRTAPDIAYHAAIIVVLIAGLLVALRAQVPQRT
jgi:hypothetical protein